MKIFTGTIISTKMDKTAVASVVRRSVHPIYKKTLKSTKKYLVHDESNSLSVGDEVTFKESRPLSRKKRHILVEIKNK